MGFFHYTTLTLERVRRGSSHGEGGGQLYRFSFFSPAGCLIACTRHPEQCSSLAVVGHTPLVDTS